MIIVRFDDLFFLKSYVCDFKISDIAGLFICEYTTNLLTSERHWFDRAIIVLWFSSTQSQLLFISWVIIRYYIVFPIYFISGSCMKIVYDFVTQMFNSLKNWLPLHPYNSEYEIAINNNNFVYNMCISCVTMYR